MGGIFSILTVRQVWATSPSYLLKLLVPSTGHGGPTHPAPGFVEKVKKASVKHLPSRNFMEGTKPR